MTPHRKEYLRTRYAADRKAGLCTSCRVEKAREGRTQCINCTLYRSNKYDSSKAAGICSECHDAVAEVGHVRCRACLVKLRGYAKAKPKHRPYTPLDEWSNRPAVRILRALRFHDWLGSAELADAMDIEASQREVFKQAIYRLHRGGKLERRKVNTYRGEIFEYRLAPGVSVIPPNDTATIGEESEAA